ncbi:PIR protein [Plasmodium vivax]|nr:PIR protein [Plasmodium vivax]
MPYKSYINSSSLNRLISRLNDTKYEICHKPTSDIFRSVDATHKETLKNIVSSIECGYNYLYATSQNTFTDLCKYLNLWLDAQKSKHVNVKSNISEEDWQIVEDLWRRLKEEQVASLQCERQHEEKNISEYSKRMELMSYCINRDYFKSLFRSSGVSNEYKEKKCIGFSHYTHENYNKLIKGIECIDNNNNIESYKYHISNECSLYNIPETFPKCDIHTPTIVKIDSSKIDIIKCKNAEQVVGGGTKLDAIPLRLVDDRDGSDVGVTGSINIPAVSESIPAVSEGIPSVSGGRLAGLKDGPPESTDLDLSPSTDASLTDNGPSKPVYYAGLSALGVVFTSIVLYKYTPLGSFIRSLVSKKEKLRKTTNKHLAQQWLERTSEYMDPNSENAHYNFPYHNIQNEFPHNR